jgi:hypothetical protein
LQSISLADSRVLEVPAVNKCVAFQAGCFAGLGMLESSPPIRFRLKPYLILALTPFPFYYILCILEIGETHMNLN